MAGVSRMPRLTFLGGLVPATAVYVGAFVGLGAAFGRSILGLIHEAEHQVLVAILLLFAAIGLIVLTRASVQRTLASLQAAGWSGPLRFQLDSVGVVLILTCLGINFAGHAMAVGLRLPLILDTTGTVLAGLIAGPWVGASVGLVSNLASPDTAGPLAAAYGIVSIAVGFAAGLSRYLAWQRRASGWISLWLVCVTISSVVSTPFAIVFGSGQGGHGLTDWIYAALIGLHFPTAIAAFAGQVAVNFPDKLITVMAALLIAHGWPARPTAAPPAQLDLGEAFTFVVRSPGWLRKLAAATACFLFIWLLVPYMLLTGYLIEIARSVRSGTHQLPAWDRRWFKIKDGFKVLLILLIWTVPGALLSIPGAIVGAAVSEGSKEVLGGTVYAVTGVLAGIGSVWGLLVLLVEAPILSEYIDRGFWAALNVAGIIRRLRVNLALSVVVGALIVMLSTIGLVGLAALVVGVLLTVPYAGLVGAYLVGRYARLTEQPLRAQARREPTLRPAPPPPEAS